MSNTDTKIEVKHAFAFPLETVFNSFLKVESAKHFMFRTATGQLLEARLDAQAGGEFFFSEKRLDQVALHKGTFVEIEPNEKISFVFAATLEGDLENEESSYVELFFQKKSEGCELTLSQELLPKYAEYKEKIINGWKNIIINGLEKYLNSQSLVKL